MNQPIDTVVIGAGQAGLAMSRCLTDRQVEHVVLDRGQVAERWRSERWDSLRLLTPNWMSRLPGCSYTGPDPHGFMTAGEVVSYLEGYAAAVPVETDSPVELVARTDDGFEVVTGRGHWRANNVVIATGWCDRPAVPPMARDLDPAIAQVSATQYRNPDSVPTGGVLIVGASATGVQLADELARAGRDVVLAVGSHSRLPRSYRGMDIYWWLERTGSLDRTIDELPDPTAARLEPSLQLAGRPDRRTLDLGTLRRAGVQLTGRVNWVDGHGVGFAPDLGRTVATADARMHRVLTEIDTHIDASGLTAEVLDPDPPPTIEIGEPAGVPLRLDLRERGITSLLWATGFRRDYPWLQVPVLDPTGEILQWRGSTPVPGLYVLGQRFQHHRNSNFIDGVGRDADTVADDLVRKRCTTS